VSSSLLRFLLSYMTLLSHTWLLCPVYRSTNKLQPLVRTMDAAHSDASGKRISHTPPSQTTDTLELLQSTTTHTDAAPRQQIQVKLSMKAGCGCNSGSCASHSKSKKIAPNRLCGKTYPYMATAIIRSGAVHLRALVAFVRQLNSLYSSCTYA